jgi:hypothetical protein
MAIPGKVTAKVLSRASEQQLAEWIANEEQLPEPALDLLAKLRVADARVQPDSNG